MHDSAVRLTLPHWEQHTAKHKYSIKRHFNSDDRLHNSNYIPSHFARLCVSVFARHLTTAQK